ncbi:hypothetical protein ELI54_01075 [Rhizobium ruizarguesonis]|uniref:hypothetical protein n=1 Tax=Rhizobium ruizarguesonis TaxID=2081791 RepID=UPI00102FD3C3|nr:hypothetical protein [Rhizobium ruizarguesonis]NEI26272.1 hypothetical protein [Rhizobium ruizarguesonis]TAT86910.1 hypothetical protein ELI54_01075 [Rhizobium ruizarguesonis]TBB90767.1 hypothetical protein ELH38_01065 [Rhizobium ruizarguesonis]
MAEVVFKEKFIAFVDILGFKKMIESAEAGNSRPLTEIQRLVKELERAKDVDFFREYGPQTCPCSGCIRKDLDFVVTQVSDCKVSSAEISPAGVINIVHHCWATAMMLLTKGVLVRGYLTRGNIFHEGREFYGTGYHHALQREATVSAFKRHADEGGTPFIEVDPSVVEYIRDHGDACVREMFSRYVKQDGLLTAIFPFQALSHKFSLTGPGLPPIDLERERDGNNNLRNSLAMMKASILEYADPSNARAMQKANHYIASLDEQLRICDVTEDTIVRLMQPFSLRR